MIEICLEEENWKSRLGKMLLGLFFGLLAALSLFGILLPLRKTVEHEDTGLNYSFVLMLINCMWDLVLSGLCMQLSIESKVTIIICRILLYFFSSHQCFCVYKATFWTCTCSIKSSMLNIKGSHIGLRNSSSWS